MTQVHKMQASQMGVRLLPLQADWRGTAGMVRLWALRILTSPWVLQGREARKRLEHHLSEWHWRLLGLEVAEDAQVGQLVAALLERRRQLEELNPRLDGPLAANLALFRERLGLTDCECWLLALAVCLHREEWFENIADSIDSVHLKSTRLASVLAAILDVSTGEVKAALRRRGRLRQSGLLEIDPNPHDLRDLFEPMQGLGEMLFEEHQDVFSLLGQYFAPAPEASLGLADFPHQRERIEDLACYLAKALELGQAGVNVLIYGPPGTGKTELARALGRVCARQTFEISACDEDGDPIEGYERFRVYRLAQQLLCREKGALLIFDEVEDVFGRDSGAWSMLSALLETRAAIGKGWINQMLETNPVPAIWLCNTIGALDPAYVRRFDVVFELGAPPKAIRRKMLERYFRRQGVGDAWLDQVAEHSRIPPALMARVAKVVEALDCREPAVVERKALRLLDDACRAMGLPPIPGRQRQILPYRLDWLNTQPSLEGLLGFLQEMDAVRMCLYGPPGTGKTAFAHHVAEALGRPLVVKRASDLLDMYVGQTEKAIARMFQEAETEQAVLLLDEVDSLLQDRRLARHTWEVVQVNELLTRMESFAGVFICATNFVERLDPACLRRFDLKVGFDYLRPEQALTLFREILAAQGQAGSCCWEERLQALRLTPGDFAAVLRRHRAGRVTAESLCRGLEQEARMRQRTIH